MTEREQEHERRQQACYQIEHELTGERQKLSDLNVEATRTRGKLESQVRESGAMEQRIAQSEKESQELAVRLEALDQDIAAHQKNVATFEEQIAQARGRMQEINCSASRCKLKCASVSGPSKPAGR
ncbi:MAG: hypothetical protein WDO73_32705 [Ignavibacteriota bacterium]